MLIKVNFCGYSRVWKGVFFTESTLSQERCFQSQYTLKKVILRANTPPKEIFSDPTLPLKISCAWLYPHSYFYLPIFGKKNLLGHRFFFYILFILFKRNLTLNLLILYELEFIKLEVTFN